MDFIDKCTYEAMTDHGEVIYPDFSTPEKITAFKKQQEKNIIALKQKYEQDLIKYANNPERLATLKWAYDELYKYLFEEYAYLFKKEK